MQYSSCCIPFLPIPSSEQSDVPPLEFLFSLYPLVNNNDVPPLESFFSLSPLVNNSDLPPLKSLFSLSPQNEYMSMNIPVKRKKREGGLRSIH